MWHIYLPQWGKVNEVWSEVVDDGAEGKPVLEKVHSYHPPHHLYHHFLHQCRHPHHHHHAHPPASGHVSDGDGGVVGGDPLTPNLQGSNSSSLHRHLGFLIFSLGTTCVTLLNFWGSRELGWTFVGFTALHLVLGWESVGPTLKTDLDLALETVTKSEFRNSHWRRNFDWSENFRLKWKLFEKLRLKQASNMRKDRVVVKGGNEGVIGLDERKDEALPVSKHVQCVYNVCTMCVQCVQCAHTYSTHNV